MHETCFQATKAGKRCFMAGRGLWRAGGLRLSWKGRRKRGRGSPFLLGQKKKGASVEGPRGRLLGKSFAKPRQILKWAVGGQ